MISLTIKWQMARFKNTFKFMRSSGSSRLSSQNRCITVQASSPRVAIALHNRKVENSGINNTLVRHYKVGSVGSYRASWELKETLVHVNPDRWHEKPEGIHYQVSYMDSAANIPRELASQFPIMLCIPSTPGTHKDFVDFVRPFVDGGIRAIIVNLPGCQYATSGSCYTGKAVVEPFFKADYEQTAFFTHTATERAEYLVTFLMQLGIENGVDLAIAHGAGAAPLLTIMATRGNPVKASVLLNAIPVMQLQPAGRPLWLTNFIARTAIDSESFRRIGNFLSSAHFARHGWKTIPPQERLAAIQVALGAYGPIMVEIARTFAGTKTPLSYVYTTKDPLVEYRQSIEFAQLLGITEEDTVLVKRGMDMARLSDKSRRKALVFNVESHYPHFNKRIKSYLQNECTRLLSLDNDENDIKVNEGNESFPIENVSNV